MKAKINAKYPPATNISTHKHTRIVRFCFFIRFHLVASEKNANIGSKRYASGAIQADKHVKIKLSTGSLAGCGSIGLWLSIPANGIPTRVVLEKKDENFADA